MRSVLIAIFICSSGLALCQTGNPFYFCTRIRQVPGAAFPRGNVQAMAEIWDKDSVVYSEIHMVKTDSVSTLCLEIGKGSPRKGKIDSILWSVGSYWLMTEFMDPSSGKVIFRARHLMREPENLDADHEQGTFELKEGYGLFSFTHSKNKRPRRIQVDLTASYVNTAYPADTYPIYRHYEWLDKDMDGSGNSFFLSYSDHSRNGFAVDTRRLGEVGLYSLVFQEINALTASNRIDIELTRPQSMVIHGQTYMLKGPTLLIYYFEW